MASFGPRRLLKVRKGGLLYKFWRPAIPRGVRPLKRVQTSARAALLPSKADQRHLGGRTWPVLVPGGCWRSGKVFGHMNLGSQLYQGVFDIVKGWNPVKFMPCLVQKPFRQSFEAEQGQMWSVEAVRGWGMHITICKLVLRHFEGKKFLGRKISCFWT